MFPTLVSVILYFCRLGGTVCDLGSGCGVLSIGSVMAGASLVYGFEIDTDATKIAVKNVSEILDDEDEGRVIEFVQGQVALDFPNGSSCDVFSRFDSFFDVVRWIKKCIHA